MEVDKRRCVHTAFCVWKTLGLSCRVFSTPAEHRPTSTLPRSSRAQVARSEMALVDLDKAIGSGDLQQLIHVPEEATEPERRASADVPRRWNERAHEYYRSAHGPHRASGALGQLESRRLNDRNRTIEAVRFGTMIAGGVCRSAAYCRSTHAGVK